MRRAPARRGFWRAVEAIFSSPGPKALETAEPAARRWSIPLATLDCLRELRPVRPVQDYQGMVAQLLAEPDSRVAGMESAAEAVDRISGCIKRIRDARPEQVVAVISHGLVLSLFIAQLENRWPTVDEWRAIPVPGVAVLDAPTWKLCRDWSSIYEVS